MRAYPPTRHAQRGSLLLIALLVLLALSSVGLVAVQNINSEIRYTGNARRGAVAYHVTESGAYGALAYADSMGPEGFIAQLALADDTDGDGRVDWMPSDLVGGALPYFDLSASGSFGYEGYLAGNEGASQSEAEIMNAMPARFEVEITSTGLRQPIIGYGFSGPGGFCRFKYQFDTEGSVGTALSDAPSEGGGPVWQRIRALMYVGPLPCDRAPTNLGDVSS